MPVERRLRQGFHRNADALEPDVDRFLSTVVHRTRRRLARPSHGGVHRGRCHVGRCCGPWPPGRGRDAQLQARAPRELT